MVAQLDPLVTFIQKIMSDSIKIFTAIFVVGGGDNAENIEK